MDINKVEINKDDIKDNFAKLISKPTLEEFHEFMHANLGETNNVEFKSVWIKLDKLSKIILGIANVGGGYIFLGVDDDSKLPPKGLGDATEDSKKFIDGIKKFIPEEVIDGIQLINLFYDDGPYDESIKGKKFQAILIEVDIGNLPVICACGSDNTMPGYIYTRRGTGTELISHFELQALLNKVVKHKKEAIQIRGLRDDLNDLLVLQEFNMNKMNHLGFFAVIEAINSGAKGRLGKFVSKMIDLKEKNIEDRLNER